MNAEKLCKWIENNENENIKSWLNNEYIKNILKSEDLIECIKSCTSPRASGKNNQITEDDLKLIFKAFSLFEPSKTRVLILGQDPYPSGKGTGFAFLLNQKKVTGRDSLYYILKAIKGNENFQPKEIEKKDNEKILKWVKDNKILLLNTALTHENQNDNTIRTHRNAWKDFTKQIIKNVLLKSENVVIYLWGVPAQDLFFQILNDNEEKISKLKENILTGKDIEKIFKNRIGKNKSGFKNGTVILYEEEFKINDNISLFMTNHPSPINGSFNEKQFRCNNEMWQNLLNIYTIQK